MDRDTNTLLRESTVSDETIRTVTPPPRSEILDTGRPENFTTPPVPSSNEIGGTEERGTRTGKQKRAERLQLVALFWSGFYAGCNDGALGPLIPRIQQVYGIGYTIVSLIFVCYCVGWLMASFASFYLTHRASFGKMVIFGSICQIVACSLQAPALPFPVFLIAYAINGFGTGLQVPQATGLIVRFKRSNDIKMGFYYGIYGIGALLIPFASTQFAQMRYWSFYYLIPLGLAVSNLISFSLVFGFKTMDDCLKLIGDNVGERNTSEHSPLREVLRIKAVHYLGFLCFLYTGIQISLGGWIVTFLLNARGGGTSTGYVASGFFAGLMLGRVVLLWVNRKLGTRLAMFCYIFLVIALELVVWLVQSFVGGAVALCFVGLLLGPMYPLAMVHIGQILPEPLVPNTVTWIWGLSMVGSAVFPFLTGAISSKYGIVTLHPLTIAMLVCMILSWALVPTRRPN